MKGWTVGQQQNTPDPIADRLAELDRLIAEQKARLAQPVAAGGGMTADQLERVLAQQAEATKELVQASRPSRHTNPDHTHVSAFSYPEGDLKRPKRKLGVYDEAGTLVRTRETFFNNHRESEDDLTPAEIDAYNAITHTCEARDGRWTAVIKRGQLHVNVPSFTMDERNDLPQGLVLILRELADGPRAVDPAEMAVRIAALEKQLADAKLVSA